MNETAERTAPRRSPWTLYLMVLVFAAPVLAAWFFYFNPEYLPEARSNRGELIEPVVPVPADLGLGDGRGGTFDYAVLGGKWNLVTLERAPCAEDCRQRLSDLRQIRLALGESRFSVARVLILLGTPQGDTVAGLEQDFEGLTPALADAAAGERLLALLGQGEASLGRIHIIDPMGNFMMRYAPDAPAKDALKDMERLLKASKSWIKGAQYGHR